MPTASDTAALEQWLADYLAAADTGVAPENRGQLVKLVVALTADDDGHDAAGGGALPAALRESLADFMPAAPLAAFVSAYTTQVQAVQASSSSSSSSTSSASSSSSSSASASSASSASASASAVCTRCTGLPANSVGKGRATSPPAEAAVLMLAALGVLAFMARG